LAFPKAFSSENYRLVLNGEKHPGNHIRNVIEICSERKLTFTFVNHCRPSVCHLSVTLVHPTQAVIIFGNISTAFGTLATKNFTEIIPKESLRRGS